MRENEVEAYLVRRVREIGGEVRKVGWIGRRGAPDRLVMLPERRFLTKMEDGRGIYHCRPARTVWVELKNPDTIRLFPSGPHERAQAREHERMRSMGQHVVVVGTIEQVEDLLS